MKKLFLFLMSFIFLMGCVEHQFLVKKDQMMFVPVKEAKKYKQEKEEEYFKERFGKYSLKIKKDYTSSFAKSGLNIDTDSNDAVDIEYGGTNAITASAARTSIGVGTGDTPQFTGVHIGSTDTTLTEPEAGEVDIEGQQVYHEGDADTIAGAISADTITGSQVKYGDGLAVSGSDLVLDLGDAHTWTGVQTLPYFKSTLQTSVPASPAAMDLVWFDPDNTDPASTGLTGAGNDYLGIYTSASSWVALLKSDGTRIHGPFQLPYSDSGDATLTEGYIQQKSDEDGIAVHLGSTGSVQDEAIISAVTHLSIPFDPEVVGGYTAHVIPIGEIEDEFPHGFKIYQWKFSFDSDPTAELAADDIYLKYADDFTTRANAVEVDDLGATSSGKSSETTAANINSGNPIPNGKFLYIDVADYSEADHICTLEIWGYAEED